MKVLVATDGSDPSNAAVRRVRIRPWPAQSTMRVLHVAPTLPAPSAPAIGTRPPPAATAPAAAPETAEQVVSSAADALRRPGLNVETVVRAGDPRTEIVAEAEEWGADLVVVGSHGRTGMKRWLVGSVAEHVVRHAPCSVEVARAAVKPPERASDE